MRKSDVEKAFNRATNCIRGIRLTAQQINVMRMILRDSEIANELEEKEKGQENGKEGK